MPGVCMGGGGIGKCEVGGSVVPVVCYYLVKYEDLFEMDISTVS